MCPPRKSQNRQKFYCNQLLPIFSFSQTTIGSVLLKFQNFQKSMKNKQEATAQLDLEKKNSIFEVWRELKDSIFNVLFVLLDRAEEEGQSMLGIIYESGLDYLQMFAFPFNASIIAVWNGGSTLNNITNFFNIVNVTTYLPNVNFNAYLALAYLLIIAIILIIVDIIYVSYSFSKKKFRFTWPLVLLGQIVPLFVTVLFLPITETLFSMVNCQPSEDDPSVQVMSSFTAIKCFQGWHLFHSVITLLFTSIFVFISSIVALALFEPRMSTNKLQARQNSTAQVVFIINKIVCQFIFNFTPFDNTYIYTIMLFVLSAWLYWAYNIQDPYYDKNVSKFFRICSSYYFWTNLMLMVSQILQGFDFNGGLVAWLGGLPFIGIIIIFEKKSNIDKLFSSDLKFRSGEQLELHLKYVLQLIQTQNTDKNSYMLLIGYIEKHKEVCNEEDCPLKTTKKKKDSDVGEMEENCRLLIKQLDRMYLNGIRKYPRSTKLRLSYAFFHLQRTKNKNKAYQEFLNAEKTDPSFEEQFIIYRFKKIIKDNLDDQEDQENNTDLIEIIRFDNHVSLCEQAMLLSSRLHKEFWTQLREQIPNLKKLNKIGSRITQTVIAAKQNFAQIQKINSTIPQVMHNYAVYLICVLQDVYLGTKILENSRKLEQEKLIDESDDHKAIENDVDAFEKENMALIVVSAKPEDIGKIVRVNLLFTEISGFFKEEIFDRKIEKVMPEIYRGRHPEMMDNWAKTQNESSKYFNVEHLAFIKQKSSFIVPVTYKIVFNPLQQVFLCHFRVQSSFKNYAYLITDPNGFIKQISASAHSYFDIHKDKLQSQSLNIDAFFENGILDNNYYVDNGKQIEYNYKGETRKYLVVAQQIVVKGNRINEQANDETQNMIETTNFSIGFQFRVQKVELKDYGKMRSQLKSLHYSQLERVDSGVSSMIMRLYETPDVSDIEKYQTAEVEEVQFINYGVKIKTLRLTNNELHMIYNEDDEDDFDNDFEQSDDEDEGKGRFDDQRYVEVVKKAINTNLEHIQIRIFRTFSLLFVIVSFAVMFFELFQTNTIYSSFSSYAKNNLYRAQESVFMNDMISASLQDPSTINETDYADKLTKHTIHFTSESTVGCLMQDGSVVTKNIEEVIILIQARLKEFYLQTSSSGSINVTYVNYLSNVYPLLFNYKEVVESDTLSVILSMVAVGLLAILASFTWIYIKLRIEKKRFDILIWFLDIPIPYVTFLCSRCDKYLKSFTGMKESISKGNQEEENYFEEYVDKKDQLEEEIEEQQKARRTLVARHKKKTLLSKLDCTYFKYFGVLLYAFIFTTANKILLKTNIDTMDFLKQQYEDTIRWVYKTGVLQIVYKLKSQGYTFTINGQTLDSMGQSISASYLNSFNSNLKEFNLRIMDFENGDLYTQYSRVYFQTLCTKQQDTVCTQLLDSNVNGGVQSMNQFLYSRAVISNDDFWKANTLYIETTILGLLDAEQVYLAGRFGNASSLTSIFLYIFAVITMLLFVSVWLMYLRELNLGLNQTIQMLNMIPLKVLPNSNKETKRFIRWIIRESNKKKHQE